MRKTVRTALAAGVGLGAHPAYPDLQGFGRRPMTLAPAELEAVLIYQVGALAGMAAAEGGRLSHVKPHGALNNQACEDAALADVVARAVRAFDRDLILLAPALSELQAAGQRAGLAVAAEIFADRAYTDAGTLVSRSRPGAVLHDPDAVVAQCRAAARLCGFGLGADGDQRVGQQVGVGHQRAFEVVQYRHHLARQLHRVAPVDQVQPARAVHHDVAGVQVAVQLLIQEELTQDGEQELVGANP
jgi:hypothetical protein